MEDTEKRLILTCGATCVSCICWREMGHDLNNGTNHECECGGQWAGDEREGGHAFPKRMPRRFGSDAPGGLAGKELPPETLAFNDILDAIFGDPD